MEITIKQLYDSLNLQPNTGCQYKKKHVLHINVPADITNISLRVVKFRTNVERNIMAVTLIDADRCGDTVICNDKFVMVYCLYLSTYFHVRTPKSIASCHNREIYFKSILV